MPWCVLSVFDVPSGLNPVPDDEVCQLYGGTYHVPLQQYSGFYGKVRRVSVILCHVQSCCAQFGSAQMGYFVGSVHQL